MTAPLTPAQRREQQRARVWVALSVLMIPVVTTVGCLVGTGALPFATP